MGNLGNTDDMSHEITHRVIATNGVNLQVTESGDPKGPCVILSHGFPESAHSWRHQMGFLADAGFHVLAPDQRGYGFSSSPKNVTDYGIENLTGDLVGLLDATGHDDATFVGHDWGSLVVWEAGRLHPSRVNAICGVSVPFTPWPMKPTELFKMMFTDRFFYMLYFQEVGPAESELEADIRNTMHQFLWAASGAMYKPGPTDFSELPPMQGSGFLDMFKDVPAHLPTWLMQDDLDHYVKQFTNSGFFGPVSWYRNLDANYEVLKDIPVERISMPTFFIGGDKDAVIAPRLDTLDAVNGLTPNYKGSVIIPGAGHWTQQEMPDEFNAALMGFLQTL
jgi:pimeloyl-ACP methyl ester carboxylesterase